MTIELREPSFLVLAALADGPKHGYALLTEVADLSDGRITLKVGSLYAIVERVESAGLVEHVRDEVVNGRLRRYFALTASGRERLAEEATRLEENASRARERLRRRPGTTIAGAVPELRGGSRRGTGRHCAGIRSRGDDTMPTPSSGCCWTEPTTTAARSPRPAS